MIRTTTANTPIIMIGPKTMPNEDRGPPPSHHQCIMAFSREINGGKMRRICSQALIQINFAVASLPHLPQAATMRCLGLIRNGHAKPIAHNR
jgi:hypothetical protein